MTQRISGAIALLLAFAACTDVAHVPSTLPVAKRPEPTTSAAATPSVTKSTPPSCIQKVFSALTEQQRIGQLFMLGLANDQLGAEQKAAIRTNAFGSVWFTEKSRLGTQRVRMITDSIQRLAQAPVTGGIKFFVAANQEGGEIQSLSGPGFSPIPPADQQGTIDPVTLQADAQRWGRQLAAAGVNFDFAPVFDVVPMATASQNQPIGVLHREYGHDGQTAADHALAFARGMARAGIVTTAKHFPGLGRVTGNTDDVSNVVDNGTGRDDADLFSFEQAVGGGVPFVMVALATYTKIDPNHLAALSPIVIQNVLRNQLHFRGVVISDDLGATVAVKSIPFGTRALEFLSAGGDMIIAKTITSAVAMSRAVLSRVHRSAEFSVRVDDAVLRVLNSKRAAGLLPCA